MTSASNLKGRIVYITGATRGIGAAIASAFAAEEATVVVNGRDAERTTDFAASLVSKYGGDHFGIAADQSSPDDILSAYRKIFKTYKRLDVLVNNAGIFDSALLGAIPEEVIENIFQVNALAVVRNMQSAARLMERSQTGSIINISSIIGRVGHAGQVVYGGSKAAVIGMTQSAAKELAPQNIRVNAIAPGLIDTELTRALPPKQLEEGLQSIGMGRIGTPEDVANVALFLGSDSSAYVTGQTIGVDGAMLI